MPLYIKENLSHPAPRPNSTQNLLQPKRKILPLILFTGFLHNSTEDKIYPPEKNLRQIVSFCLLHAAYWEY